MKTFAEELGESISRAAHEKCEREQADDAVREACKQLNVDYELARSQLNIQVRKNTQTNEVYTIHTDPDGTPHATLAAVQRLKDRKIVTPPATERLSEDQLKALSNEEYRRLRKKSPAALGLRPGGGRR